MTEYSQENVLLYHHEYQTMPTNTPPIVLSDLEEIIYNYQTQPELLKLILSSKLEEDKRRAEEARLKAKELDLLLLQQQQNQATFYPDYSFADVFVDPGEDQLLFHPIQATTTQYNDGCDSLLSPSYTCSSDELEDSTLFQSYPIMTSYENQKEVAVYNNEALFDNSKQQQYEFQHYDIQLQEDMMQNNRTKRKREMQAITKIVETREYPYLDGYFWKNNGNTIQKKTGNKSIYYKCSNSNKGCPVNKTVTWKGNGDYLIKYRGEHLIECNKVKRINL